VGDIKDYCESTGFLFRCQSWHAAFVRYRIFRSTQCLCSFKSLTTSTSLGSAVAPSLRSAYLIFPTFTIPGELCYDRISSPLFQFWPRIRLSCATISPDPRRFVGRGGSSISEGGASLEIGIRSFLLWQAWTLQPSQVFTPDSFPSLLLTPSRG
jgi:hypothetical protein